MFGETEYETRQLKDVVVIISTVNRAVSVDGIEHYPVTRVFRYDLEGSIEAFVEHIQQSAQLVEGSPDKPHQPKETQTIKPEEIGSLDKELADGGNTMTEELRDVAITATFKHEQAQGPFHTFSFETDGSRAMMYEMLCKALHEADPAAIQWLMDKVAHIEQAQEIKVTNI
jgi:hypothetical protein